MIKIMSEDGRNTVYIFDSKATITTAIRQDVSYTSCSHAVTINTFLLMNGVEIISICSSTLDNRSKHERNRQEQLMKNVADEIMKQIYLNEPTCCLLIKPIVTWDIEPQVNIEIAYSDSMITNRPDTNKTNIVEVTG